MQWNGGRVGRSYHVKNVHNWEDLEWPRAINQLLPGHIKRQYCKSKELYFARFIIFGSYRARCVTKLFSGWLFVRSIFRSVILHASLKSQCHPKCFARRGTFFLDCREVWFVSSSSAAVSDPKALVWILTWHLCVAISISLYISEFWSVFAVEKGIFKLDAS